MTERPRVLALALRSLRRALLFGAEMKIRFYPTYHFRRWLAGGAIVSVNGFQMYLDLKNDTGISKDLFIFRKREHISTDLLITEGVLKPGDTVVDIGANIGYYALIESRLVGNDGRVFAIEPVSANFSLLQKNISLNNASNVRTYKLAVGDVNKEDEILVAEKGNFSSFTRLQGERYRGTERVHVVTLDSFVEQHNIVPTLVRMDVEGYETEILKGMKMVLKQRPKLLIEVHPHLMDQARLQGMFALIAGAGYEDAVVIKDKKDVWMRRNGSVKRSLLLLTKWIGDAPALGAGDRQNMSTQHLQSLLSQKGSAFHVLLS